MKAFTSFLPVFLFFILTWPEPLVGSGSDRVSYQITTRGIDTNKDCQVVVTNNRYDMVPELSNGLISFDKGKLFPNYLLYLRPENMMLRTIIYDTRTLNRLKGQIVFEMRPLMLLGSQRKSVLRILTPKDLRKYLGKTPDMVMDASGLWGELTRRKLDSKKNKKVLIEEDLKYGSLLEGIPNTLKVYIKKKGFKPLVVEATLSSKSDNLKEYTIREKIHLEKYSISIRTSAKEIGRHDDLMWTTNFWSTNKFRAAFSDVPDFVGPFVHEWNPDRIDTSFSLPVGSFIRYLQRGKTWYCKIIYDNDHGDVIESNTYEFSIRRETKAQKTIIAKRYFDLGLAFYDSTGLEEESSYNSSLYRDVVRNFDLFLSQTEERKTLSEYRPFRAIAFFYRGNSYYNLAWYREMKNDSRAVEYYEKAEQDFDQAEAYFATHRGSRESYRARYSKAWVVFRLAELTADEARKRQRFEEARSQFVAAFNELDRADRFPMLRDEAQFMIGYLTLRLLRGEQLGEAVDFWKTLLRFDEALGYVEPLTEAGFSVLHAAAEILRGELYYEIGKFTQAVPDEVWEAFDESLRFQVLRGGFARTERSEFASEMFRQARTHFDRAEKINGEVRAASLYGNLLSKLNIGSMGFGTDFARTLLELEEVLSKLSREPGFIEAWKDELALRGAAYRFLLASQFYADKEDYERRLDLAGNQYAALSQTISGTYRQDVRYWLGWTRFRRGNFNTAQQTFRQFVRMAPRDPTGRELFMKDWGRFMGCESGFQRLMQQRRDIWGASNCFAQELSQLTEEDVKTKKYMRQVVFGIFDVDDYLRRARGVENLDLLGRELLQIAVGIGQDQRQQMLERAEEIYQRVVKMEKDTQRKARANLILAGVLTYQVETLKALGQPYQEKFDQAEVALKSIEGVSLCKREARHIRGKLYSTRADDALSEAKRIFDENTKKGDHRAPKLWGDLRLRELQHTYRGKTIPGEELQDVADMYQITLNTVPDIRDYWHVQARKALEIIGMSSSNRKALPSDEVAAFRSAKQKLGFSYEDLTVEELLRKSVAEEAMRQWRLYSRPKAMLSPSVAIDERLDGGAKATLDVVVRSTREGHPFQERGMIVFVDRDGNPLITDRFKAPHYLNEDLLRQPQTVHFHFRGFYSETKEYDFTVPQPPDTVYIRPAVRYQEAEDWGGELEYPGGIAGSPEGAIYTVDRKGIFRDKKRWVKAESLFGLPMGIAVSDGGEVYVADARKHQVVVFDPDGKYLRSFGESELQKPTDVAWFEGVLYMADSGKDRIARFKEDGKFLGGFGKDRLCSPNGVIVDREGRIFVADWGHHRVVVFDAHGRFVRAFGKQGHEDGNFTFPMRIAIEYVEDRYGKERYIFVLDRNRIQKFDAEGKFLQVVSEFEGTPSLRGISISGAGEDARLYVAEREKGRVNVYGGGWFEEYVTPKTSIPEKASKVP